MIFNGTKELETERLLLRKIQPDDYVVAYKEWCSDPEQVKYTIHGIHKSEMVTKNVYDKWIEEYNDPKTLRWMIVLKDTNEQIGTIDINNTWSKYGCVEPGYIIARKHWKKGYASEVLRRVIEYLLTEQDFYLVEANHRSSNPASGRVMEKAGMKYDGTLRERRINPDGTRADMIYYSITKNEL